MASSNVNEKREADRSTWGRRRWTVNTDMYIATQPYSEIQPQSLCLHLLHKTANSCTDS